MSATTKIEWTDRTWNPITGCTKVSAGCDNCYAETQAERFRGTPAFPKGFDVDIRASKISAPLSWRKPARVFVNSMSDLFHKDIPDEYIAKVFATMARTPQHTYQILTKRHGRMRSLVGSLIDGGQNLIEAAPDEDTARALYDAVWPLPNVWLGVSVEDQKRADLRIPALVDTAAAVRFLSCEPLLGPVSISDHIWATCTCCDGEGHDEACATCADSHCESGHMRQLHWVIVGGESGRGARPMAPQWATGLRDECKQDHVPFFFKQWGEYAPTGDLVIGGTSKGTLLAGEPVDELGHRHEMRRVGKKAAGRELGGRTHDAFPATTTTVNVPKGGGDRG